MIGPSESTPGDDERVKLTREQVDARMPEGNYVHTLMQASGGVFIGADWPREDILALAERGLAEEAGPRANAMKHGIAVWRYEFPVFVATKEKSA